MHKAHRHGATEPMSVAACRTHPTWHRAGYEVTRARADRASACCRAMGSDSHPLSICEGSGDFRIAAPADIAPTRETATKVAYSSDGDDSDDASAASLATTCTTNCLSARSDCCTETWLGQVQRPKRLEASYEMFTDDYDVPCSAADLAAARDKYTTILAHRGPMACEAHPWGLALWPGFDAGPIQHNLQVRTNQEALCAALQPHDHSWRALR